MAKKRVMKSERGIALTEVILFGGQPRKNIGKQYIVSSERRPEGKAFDTIDEAAKYFHVQVSLSGGATRRPAGTAARPLRGLGRTPKTA